jgi:DoxX-like family
MGALRLPPFIDTATHLGYPTYFMTILGVWYVSAGIVVLAPRLPRLKEWAYAGLIFNYTGAAFSHVWIGDGCCRNPICSSRIWSSSSRVRSAMSAKFRCCNPRLLSTQS